MMPDREKVIEAFDEAKELVWTDDDEYTVGYNNGLEAGKNIAIALLKEQEAIPPIPYHRSDGTIFKYECRKCRTKIFKGDLFCRHCGKPVLWEGR